LAGLWDTWRSPDGGDVESRVIVTTPANSRLAELHDRMPEILARSAIATWLDPIVCEPAELEPCVQPYPAELMRFEPASALMNNPRHDSPECLNA
jgi:putative SOS response-associated peptidase YedK